jgi:hypothetical protein
MSPPRTATQPDWIWRAPATRLRSVDLPIHDRKGLARLHKVAFIDEELRNAAGELGVDIDLVGLKATVAGSEARGQRRRPMEPPVGDCRCGCHESQKRQAAPQPAPLASAPLQRYRNLLDDGQMAFRLGGEDFDPRLGAADARFLVALIRHAFELGM